LNWGIEDLSYWGSKGPSNWEIKDPFNWGSGLIESPLVDGKNNIAGTLSTQDLVHELSFCFQFMDLPHNLINKLSSSCKSRFVSDGNTGSNVEAIGLL
jgi:hypothetical protein